ncbi:MAG: hypothetical protein GX621_04165, partial [Pirellulaceae bacterium]|nr:hypothetical protein [Pirellulaceae bacterium]
MRYWAHSCFLVFFATSATTSAALVVTAGDHRFWPDETRTIAIQVTGGDLIEGLDLYVQIGDGGEYNGGTDTTPVIVGVDIVGPGTIFEPSNDGQMDDLVALGCWAGTFTLMASPLVPAEGVLGFLSLDATGTQPGETYPLLLTGVMAGVFGEPGIDTSLINLDPDFPTPTIHNGSILIVPIIPGDANRDEYVDELDAKILAANWGQSGGRAEGDFNGDGVVNALDAAILAANWGHVATTEQSGHLAAVPEPGGVTLLSCGVIAGLLR